jgi:perosamine synthetase
MKVFTRIEYEDCSYIKRIPVAEPSFGENERRYLNECLSSGWISSQGLFVERFERELAEKLGVPEAVAVSSGTAALHLAVAALGIGPGDEVIVPDLTFAATINSVLHCGATPVLVDVDVDSWTMLPSEVESAITARTRAVLPVHLYGQMAAMDELIALARRHNLLIIEDAAQALGSRLGEQLAGTIGDAGAFSMFANKLISTGEGGMIIFRDAAAAARARVLRDHGMTPGRRYWHDTVGFNYRLTNL